MGVKVATTCLHWSQPIVHHHSPSPSQTLASAISSPSSQRRSRSDGGALVCRYVHRLDRSALFGTPSTKLQRSRSCEVQKSRIQPLKRACSASLDAFSDEEFSKKIQELALRFQLSDDDDNGNSIDEELEMISDFLDNHGEDVGGNSSKFDSSVNFVENQRQFPPSSLNPVEPPWLGIRQEPPDWQRGDEIIPASIERKANSVDLPLSLRIIKRKKQWQEGFREVGESAYCSVKKAFSSMVFIIRELQSYTLQMREILFYEDLQGILGRVQREMNASFVWLFQQVFSHTPTLMVYVMVLLANFTVYSMGNNAAIAAAPPLSYAATTESVSVIEDQSQKQGKFDSSVIKSFSVSSSGGKTTSIGGNNGGGGGKPGPISSGTDGDGGFERSNHHRKILPDGVSQVSSVGNPATTREANDHESVSGQEAREEEVNLWNSIVEEASSSLREKSLDHYTMQRFVSPVTAKIEEDDYADYFRTELLYQTGLAHEPQNTLLLANYAQFLYLVAHDYDRAEEYFKKAVGVEPADAEAFNKYATFLWTVRKDLWTAEERYLEAISADPGNAYYAANYAHFLWSTGGEDTCFPLNSPDTTQET